MRTRSGGSAGGEATVAYPVTVYVFSGEECRAVQTIDDEALRRGVNIVDGKITYEAVAKVFGLPYMPLKL